MAKRIERTEEVVEEPAETGQAVETQEAEFYEAIPYGATQDPTLYDAGAYATVDREGSWLASILMLTGIWLILAPYLLGYATNTASTNDVITGIAVGIVAAIGALAATRSRALSWLMFIGGAWLVISPFALGYSNDATPMWNDIIVGAVIIALSLWRVGVARTVDDDYE